MIYTISNDLLTVDISSTGAELMSIRDNSGTEYLWQGDKTYWGGRAYNLFPICGRLTEGKYVYDGKEYEMNLHGFLRKSELTPFAQSDASIGFRLVADDRTRAMYPFEFEYRIIYTLNEKRLSIAIEVKNSGGKPMYYALGGHHGFNVPFADDTFDDYYLEFCEVCEPKSIPMSDTCYTLRGENAYPLKDGKILPLRHSLFDNDAIILKDVAGTVRLKSQKHDKCVAVSYPETMKYLGLWHAPKTEAPYISIEPWTGVPAYDNEVDNLAEKRDMTVLQPGAADVLCWRIEIE